MTTSTARNLTIALLIAVVFTGIGYVAGTIDTANYVKRLMPTQNATDGYGDLTKVGDEVPTFSGIHPCVSQVSTGSNSANIIGHGNVSVINGEVQK